MENNQLEKFDPSSLMQGVRDRIKATFVSLIPDENWEKMIELEVDRFFKKSDKSYGNRYSASDFDVIVRQCLEEKSKEEIIKYLDENWVGKVWNSNANSYNASEKLEKIFIEKSGEIVAATFGSMINGAISTIVNRNRNY